MCHFFRSVSLLQIVITAADAYLFAYPTIPATAMTGMVRNPNLVDGVGGFKIDTAHPLQPFGSGAVIRGYDTLVYGRPHMLRMFYADASTTTSFVCMKHDGTPLIFLNFTVMPLAQNGCVLRVDAAFTRSPEWLSQTLRPLLKFVGAIAMKNIL